MAEHHDSTPEADRFLALVRGGDGGARFRAAQAIDVPVDGGTIRVYRIPGSGSGRPVVFVSGWGTVPETFEDFFGAASPDTEIYHVESREKPSSRIERRAARFDMDQYAADLRTVMHHLKLNGRDPVLMGTCFGSAIILHGLAAGVVDAPTVVCVDPMVRLWVPRWLIVVAILIVPPFVLRILRPPLRVLVLAGMREPVQRARTASFINSAVLWKWRKGAVYLRNWNFFAIAAQIRRRVYVMNASHDRFHNTDLFPEVARAVPDSVFIRVPVGESRRERFMGVTATVFAATTAGAGVPSPLSEFVVPGDYGDAASVGQSDTA